MSWRGRLSASPPTTHLLALALALAAPALPAAAAPAAPSRYEIQLLDQRFTPAPGVTAAEGDRLAAAAADVAKSGGKTVHVLVQFHETPSDDEKISLVSDGLDLGAYVPGSAWIAAVPAAEVAGLAKLSEVRWATVWDASRKLHPRLEAGEIGAWARDPSRPGFVMLFVLLHHDVAIEAIDKIADRVGGVAMPPLDGLHGATVWVPQERIADLAREEEVLWMEEGLAPLTPTNAGLRATMLVDPVNAPPYNLDGTGVRLFVFDGGTIRATHETFRVGAGPSRVTVIDATAVNDHPTHVGGTAGGDGAPSSPGGNGRGVAPDVTIFSAGYEQFFGTMLFWDNAGDIQADYSLARNTHAADLGTNSIGSNTASNGYPCAREGDYGVSSNLIDGIVRGDNVTVGSAVIMAWANGNERTGDPVGGPVQQGRCGVNYVTTAPPSCAKNPIHVGAVYSDGAAMTPFSSWGPCDDGRLKPVVSAPGCETGRVTGETGILSSTAVSDTSYGFSCGTSMATPGVAGVISLLIEDWRAQGHGGAFARPLPALVKSLVVHTSRDLGQDGPDFIYGYGEVEAKPLIDTMRAGTGALGTANPVNWGTDSVAHAATDTFNITVPPGTGELKATLAWDDAAAVAFAANAVVNNLNLELVAPGGIIIHRPWILSSVNPHLPATTGVNNLDNQEQVLVEYPTPGVWTMRVIGTNVPTGPQSYGLVYTYKKAAFYNPGCLTTAWGWEPGLEGWTLTGGTARVAAPAAGHGAWSLRFGGVNNATHEATLNVAIPARIARAEWTFWWYMTTAEGPNNNTYDHFIAEVRDAVSGVTLEVFDVRWDSWRQNAWMQQQNIDLTKYAGQTIRLAFRARTNPTNITTFWVDDSQLVTCKLGDIWCQDTPSDTGLEPDPATAAQPMWTSQDIWVRNFNDAGTVHQNPEFGQPNFIYVKIRNRGTTTVQNAPVKVYVANASTGLSWPTMWTYVGEAFVVSLAPLATTTVVVPWTPAGTGHYCIVARIDTPQDPMTNTETTNIDFNTRFNNNICWKNVNVVNLVLSAGGFDLVNAKFIFRNVARDTRPLRLTFGETKSTHTHPFVARGRVTVVLTDKMAQRWRETGGIVRGMEQVDDLTFVLRDPAEAYLDITVDGGEEFPVALTFQDLAVPAADTNQTLTYTIHAVQHDLQTREEVGGVAYEITASPPL